MKSMILRLFFKQIPIQQNGFFIAVAAAIIRSKYKTPDCLELRKYYYIYLYIYNKCTQNYSKNDINVKVYWFVKTAVTYICILSVPQ